jgi:hypothetical protein
MGVLDGKVRIYNMQVEMKNASLPALSEQRGSTELNFYSILLCLNDRTCAMCMQSG